MFSRPLNAYLSARNRHYAWVVAFVTFLTMLVTAGAVGAPGVFMVPLQEEFRWSASEVSGALAIRFALFGLMGPFAAAFMNRFGVRRMMLISMGIVVSALLLSLGMNRLWQLVLLWGVVVGLGTGLTAVVLGATIATRWFAQRRGLVMGFLAASTATGQLVFLPLLASLTEHSGWRVALGLVCGAILFSALLVLLLMRDRPADLGLAPYGGDMSGAPPAPSGGLGAALLLPLIILKDAARTPTFWILFGTFFVCGASTNGLIQMHFIALCGDYGLAAVGAAGFLAMMGLFDFIGTVGSGWLSDRFDNRWLLFWYYGLRGLSLLYLPFSGFSLYGLSIFAIFYGLDWVATVPPTVKLTADRFGPERANVVFGWIFAGHQLGAASAAFGGGLSRTALNSYLPAFIAAGALCILAALLALAIRPGARQGRRLAAA
ncbi:MFS transporter [Sphingobium phenoxybenzoativorans]|uniref:MFS transporter n=1 Tax=Sphingobium phenoxybenzoativorans TaxID=1592790 RepID=A0A975Q033_9SPHN|nr:MFS transporter [Sphingobium phenoxybenzoativorans]QUT04211.1 MFS transporter [Sphingobium phenoxybenzoativorans]